MIEKADELLLKTARLIIIFATFFGIDRQTTMNLWIFLAGFFDLVYYAYTFEAMSKVLVQVSSVVLTIICILWANFEYRDDDILPSFSLGAEFRVFAALVPTISRLHILLLNPNTVCLLSVPSQLFFIYFLLNQSPKNPLRLRSIIKNLVGRVQQVPTPSPQPVPIRITTL